MLFSHLEIKMECPFFIFTQFYQQNIYSCINLIKFWHRPTRYFQLSNIESRLNVSLLKKKKKNNVFLVTGIINVIAQVQTN